jgi:cystathionine beta-lyase/cystathionine gamma-synthase
MNSRPWSGAAAGIADAEGRREADGPPPPVGFPDALEQQADGPHAHPWPELVGEGRQMRAGGGMVSFIPKPGAGGRSAAERAVAIAESTRLFTLAESLGGVESLVEVPATMTHASVAGSHLEVDPALVRLSVGIEHVDDLVQDLRQALDRA